MQTFHNDKALKSRFLKELRWHRKADKLIRGTYGADCVNGDFRGCAVGCSVHSLNRIAGKKKYSTDSHAAYESGLGIPKWLAHLEDRLFEGMPEVDAMEWPQRFSKAIHVGVDKELLHRNVLCPFLVFVLQECRPNARSDGQKAIDTVIALLNRRQRGDKPRDSEWSSARSAAAAAAAADAYAAAAAAYAAYAAYAADAYAAAAAAADAAAYSVRLSVRQAAYIRYADELVRLLSAQKAN